VLISYETHAHVKDEIYCEEHGPIRVKGIACPIAPYGVSRKLLGQPSGPSCRM
jgi:class 3 adenylate cyclase